jgi:hypothetical protein
MSLSCLQLDLLAGDLVMDLLDLGDHEDLLLRVDLPLGVAERLLDVGGAALPLDDDGGFMVEVLLLSGLAKSVRGCDLLRTVLWPSARLPHGG